MQKVKIEKGIPVPRKKCGNAGQGKYPYREMQVGDSIYVDTASGGQLVSVWGKYSGFVFTSRQEGKGRRIWRIS